MTIYVTQEQYDEIRTVLVSTGSRLPPDCSARRVAALSQTHAECSVVFTRSWRSSKEDQSTCRRLMYYSSYIK
jgi:hypothetical protein